MVLFFVDHKRKKVVQVWNDLTVSELRQIFYFGVNYPFKSTNNCTALSLSPCLELKVHLKMTIHLLTLRLFQTCMTYFC